jgi:DNA polymerase-4
VTLRLRFDDFSRVTRSHTLTEPTAQNQTILATGRDLLAAALPLIAERGITLLGISLGNLVGGAPGQLALPVDGQTASAVDVAVDGVRERFGTGAITRAVLLGHDTGFSVPLLPD